MAAKNEPRHGSEAATPAHLYEVRCASCNVSFPPGTRRCIHCGGRIGRQLRVEAGLPLPVEEGEEPEEEMPGGSAARAGIWAVTAIIAMAGSLFRMCQGG